MYSYEDPKTVFDAISITNYFGGKEAGVGPERTALFEAIRDPAVNEFTYMKARLLDPAYRASVPETAGFWQGQKDLATNAKVGGMKLIAYEGGQHFNHHGKLTDLPLEDQDLIRNFQVAFVRSPEMRDLYQAAWDAWAAVSDGTFMQFSVIGKPSKYGSWMMWEGFDRPTLRGQLLDSLNQTTPNWWGSPVNARYQRTLPAL